MFGYVLPTVSELKVKEHELYKAYYCGICHSIKKRYGQLPRFLLQYDMAFLAMILEGLINKKNNVENRACIASPFKKKAVICNDNVLEYCADMNVILGYYKLKDNLYDNKNFLYYIPISYIWVKVHKKLKKYKTKLDIIETQLKELRELEEKRSNDLDLLSDKFAEIMKQIFLYPQLDEENKKILQWLGFNLGKWVYIIDAYDDIEDDLKKKQFNPFITDYKDENVKDIKDRNKTRIKNYLFHCLDQVAKSLELLDLKKNINVLKNIIYIGLAEQTEERCNN